MNIEIIGKPGSGKTTQAKILSKKLKIPLIKVGEILRSAKGDFKKEVEKNRIQGNFVSNKLILEILRKRLVKKDVKKGFVIEGAPRNISQMRGLEKIAKLDKIIEIYIPDSESKKRLQKRKREDDSVETVEKRLKLYNKNTVPVLKHYKKQKRLIKIDGTQPIKKISKDIEKSLKI